jgi:hypothetical protein
MRSHVLALALVVAAPGRPPPRGAEARVWYDIGHRLVARLAALRLTSHTVEAVRDLLGGQDLADASLWADQIRGQRRDTEPLHYVNIPLEADSFVPELHCPGGRCIIAAIESDERVLADSTASLPERAEALRFLIHFIADLHQPLHVSNNNDRGGNQRAVYFFGTARNLHEVWDGELIENAPYADESQYFDHLRQMMDSMDLPATERGTVVDWAMEGHRLAVEYAYRLPPSGRISDKYLEANLPVVDLALIRAGVRLAKVLNNALASYRRAPAPAAAAGPHIYSDREAAAHVGEVATVVGTVVTVHRSAAGNIFLNFGASYPHQTFSGAVLNPRGPWQGLDTLAGKRVGVRGLIKVYKGQVEIVIEGPEQIVAAP